MKDYDRVADAAVKKNGNRLSDSLQGYHQSRDPDAQGGWAAHDFAVKTMRAAFGVLPIGDGLNKLTDDQVRALAPRVEAAADFFEAFLQQKI